MSSLFIGNDPARFWRCLAHISWEEWVDAIGAAVHALPDGERVLKCGPEALFEHFLGEGYLGAKRWKLSRLHRNLYHVRPFVPEKMVTVLRRLYQRRPKRAFPLAWPIEDHYARFLLETVRQVLNQRGLASIPHIAFWPNQKRFALVLTHDVDTEKGQEFVRDLANLEESLGFRACFNFVPERYPVDKALLSELKERGFEIGVHGLKHDGRLYASHEIFRSRATKINQYLREWGSVGFRSPLAHRQPEWQQGLDIEYDSSFFDTDPFETMAGGTMSLWPFFIGQFVELPYTLPQDQTLMIALGEQTPRIWMEKVDFISKYSGMALSVTHPDYLREPGRLAIYERFLESLRHRDDYWHALPREVARWWRARAQASSPNDLPGAFIAQLRLDEEGVVTDLGERRASGVEYSPC